MTNSKIHWFSIVNSLVVALLLASFIAMIIVRTLRRDLQQYENQNLDEESQQEETGWKLIHGDVFRPPPHGGLFSMLVGTGVQLFGMTAVTLLFAVLGFLSPANRGSLMTAFLMLFAFMGILAGYTTTRIYTMLGLPNWKTNTLWTALGFPAFAFTIFFGLNLLIWGEKSSGAVPFTTLLALLAIWFGVSVPLVYLGAHIASLQHTIPPPIKVNLLPRDIPPSNSLFLNSSITVLLGGVPPFAAAFVEISYLLSSIWLHQLYYIFGFLVIIVFILMITCAEISIVLCYFHLCREDYRWWWRSFITSGCSAFYLFLYSGFYFCTQLDIIGTVPALLYFGYMTLVSLAFFLFTGTVGFISCYFFVSTIYSSLKID